MPDDRTKLLFGPYRSPTLRKGDGAAVPRSFVAEEGRLPVLLRTDPQPDIAPRTVASKRSG
jgi:hypothetical protein